MKQFIINIVGDVCLKNIDDTTYNFSKEIEEIFSQATLNVANLECVLTTNDTPAKYRTIRLKGDTKENPIFKTFHIYALANNHIMDYGREGLVDTLNFLTLSHKSFFGAGLNEEEALKPLLIEQDGLKVAFLTFNRFDVAKKQQAGTAPEKFNVIKKYIKELKAKDYFVIVYPHWNYQWVEYPAPDERKKGYNMIDAGADIVVGAHPHIVQGVEVYKGKKIFHSLGNFVFRNTKYTKSIPQFGKSFILQLLINEDKTYETKVIPVYNDNDGVRLSTNTEQKDFFEYLDSISDVLYDKKKSHKLFYESGKSIGKNNKVVFGELKKDGGYLAILNSYRQANWQDIKRKLYTLFI